MKFMTHTHSASRIQRNRIFLTVANGIFRLARKKEEKIECIKITFIFLHFPSALFKFVYNFLWIFVVFSLFFLGWRGMLSTLQVLILFYYFVRLVGWFLVGIGIHKACIGCYLYWLWFEQINKSNLNDELKVLCYRLMMKKRWRKRGNEAEGKRAKSNLKQFRSSNDIMELGIFPEKCSWKQWISMECAQFLCWARNRCWNEIHENLFRIYSEEWRVALLQGSSLLQILHRTKNWIDCRRPLIQIWDTDCTACLF